MALPLAAFALAACATSAPDPASASACATGQPGPIAGDWALERIDGEAWTRTPVTLYADAGRLGGGMACNAYGTLAPDGDAAPYDVSSGRMEITSEMIVTLAGCVDDWRRRFDERFQSILAAEPAVARDGDELCLYTDDGRSLEFRRTAAESDP